MSFTQLIVGIAIGYAIFLLFFGLAVVDNSNPIKIRMANMAARRRTLEEIELSRPFGERVLGPMLRSLAKLAVRFVPRLDLADVQRKLNRAGNPYRWTALDFLGVRCLTALIGLIVPVLLILLGAGMTTNMIILTVASAALGFYVPVYWLGRRTRARQKEMRLGLPDALDLLTLGVEAGLSFEPAMERVAEHTDSEISRAFQRVLTEVQLGKPRAQALRDMAEMADLPELTHFVTALVQADQLGVSIVKVLRIQADEMRIKRRQRAEEEAHRAPVKMSVVLVLFLLPAIFLIVLGPSVQRICHLFSPDNPFCGI